MKFYLISILLVLVSCNGQKKTVAENSANSQVNQENSPMVLLLQEEYSEFDIVETLVIKDQKTLKSFYSKISRTRKPGFPVPTVDFSKEMIVVHCNGEQHTIGVATLILDKETDTTLQLMSKFESEESQQKRTVTTYPFSVYKIPLSGKDVLVEKSDQ